MEKTIGKHSYDIQEITAMKELDCLNAFRKVWRSQFGIGDAVSSEAERLVICAAMITKIDGKEVKPVDAFGHLLELNKNAVDILRSEFMRLNEQESFFVLLGQLAEKYSVKDISSKSSEDSAGKAPTD